MSYLAFLRNDTRHLTEADRPPRAAYTRKGSQLYRWKQNQVVLETGNPRSRVTF